MDYLKPPNCKDVRVLLTGAGAPGGPGIIKALQLAGFNLYAGDCNDEASGRFLNDKFVLLPRADDDSFVDIVLQFCTDNDIQVVFPLVTKELFKFARLKHLFLEKNIRVIVSNYESLSIANDKGKLYAHLYKNNISIPQFKIVNSLNDLQKAVIELGYPAKAVCIKPTVSNGSRGVRILQKNIDEFDLLFNHKPNNLYSSLDKIAEILKDKKFPQMLVSEYLPGSEYTVDTIDFALRNTYSDHIKTINQFLGEDVPDAQKHVVPVDTFQKASL